MIKVLVSLLCALLIFAACTAVARAGLPTSDGQRAPAQSDATSLVIPATPAPLVNASPEPSQLRAQGEIVAVRDARLLTVAGKNDEAVKTLRGAIEHEKDKSQKALLHLAFGIQLYLLNDLSNAEIELTSALNEGLRIPEYAYLYRGRVNRAAGRLGQARDDLQKALSRQTPVEVQTDIKINLASIAIDESAWKSAAAQFTTLHRQRSLQSDQRYPEITYQLMRASRHLNLRAKACLLAREVFSKFPTYAPIKDWGVRLEDNVVDGEKTGCVATGKDLQTRARRLELGGESERASSELSSMQATTHGAAESSVDSMMANNLLNDGRVDDAMKILMRQYAIEKNHPEYLNLLGKALTRVGDYGGAVSAFYRAYEVAPRSEKSAKALFQAAFTSYQMQDYDGATRAFEQLAHAFAKSSLTKDGKWYVAWMRYLRGDYEGALDSFTHLRLMPKTVRRRRGRRTEIVDAVAGDRLDYWSAMCLMKLGRTQESIERLQKLARDPAIGYYSVLAFYRLQKIPGAEMPGGLELRLGLKKQNSTNGNAELPTAEELKSATEALQAAADDEATTTADAASDDPDGGAADSSVESADSGKNEFKGAGLALRFQRARDLASIGQEEFARRELGEIEKRARSSSDRKLLMQEYAIVRQFFRSSTIGELGFGPDRLRDGLRAEGRTYWEYAYPRAWDGAVLEASQSSNVPEELIWGIMRAESHYRASAQSGVGALGLMQLMPFTGRKVADLSGIKSFQTGALLEPEINIRLGSRYLKRLLDKFSGSVALVAASYNAGPHRVHAWVKNFGNLDMDEFIEHIPFLETRNYVKKVVRNYQIYNLIYSRGAHSAKWVVEPVGVRLNDPIPTHEIW